MAVLLINVGKTKASYLRLVEETFTDRIKRFHPYERIDIKDVKHGDKGDIKGLKSKEAEAILKSIKPNDFVVLLDVKGKEYRSPEFAKYVEGKFNHYARMVFVSGGAYGFADEMYERANHTMSLSKMTFSHQLVRSLFLEQLYRAFTIINGHPYHNA